MLPLLRHNGNSWKCWVLGEAALLIEPEFEGRRLDEIQKFVSCINAQKLNGLVDVVPAYASIALFFNTKQWNHERLIQRLAAIKPEANKHANTSLVEIPVCYGLGLDWQRVEAHTGLKKAQIIKEHSTREYTVAMVGFVPGFIFLAGLNPRLATPRLEHPRTQIPAGSVGIGGAQTGLYSLESPGGWNIIGRTNKHYFNPSSNPPMSVSSGFKVRFIPIPLKDFGHG